MSLLGSAVRFAFIALSVASIYLLVAIGLSIVFGSLKYVNMAHGALYMLGGYIGVFIAFEKNVGGFLSDYSPLGLGLGVVAALILVPILIFLIGIVNERLIAKPFYGRDMVDQLLVTFGILLIVKELAAILTGRGGFSFQRPEWAQGPIALPGVSASTWRVTIIGLTLLLVVAILLFYKRTNYGLAVRAGTEDAEMTRMLGIRVSRPYLLIFAIGAAYAGLAGVLGGSVFNIEPAMGVDTIIPAITIVIAGGVGSIKGTVITAILAGVAFTSMTILYSPMAIASIYGMAVLILIIRPTGLYPSEVTG
jgi:branched-chain amino acid transport system permease protein